MSSIGSATSTAALQAADRTTDKALADATKKLAADRKAHASDAILRADQKTLSAATKSAAAIDSQIAKESSSATEPRAGGTLTVTA